MVSGWLPSTPQRWVAPSWAWPIMIRHSSPSSLPGLWSTSSGIWSLPMSCRNAASPMACSRAPSMPNERAWAVGAELGEGLAGAVHALRGQRLDRRVSPSARARAPARTGPGAGALLDHGGLQLDAAHRDVPGGHRHAAERHRGQEAYAFLGVEAARHGQALHAAAGEGPDELLVVEAAGPQRLSLDHQVLLDDQERERVLLPLLAGRGHSLQDPVHVAGERGVLGAVERTHVDPGDEADHQPVDRGERARNRRLAHSGALPDGLAAPAFVSPRQMSRITASRDFSPRATQGARAPGS